MWATKWTTDSFSPATLRLKHACAVSDLSDLTVSRSGTGVPDSLQVGTTTGGRSLRRILRRISSAQNGYLNSLYLHKLEARREVKRESTGSLTLAFVVRHQKRLISTGTTILNATPLWPYRLVRPHLPSAEIRQNNGT